MTTGGVWDPSAGTPGPHTQHCPSPIAPLPPGEPHITSRYLIRDTSRAPPVLEESSWRSGVCWGGPWVVWGISCPGGCQAKTSMGRSWEEPPGCGSTPSLQTPQRPRPSAHLQAQGQPPMLLPHLEPATRPQTFTPLHFDLRSLPQSTCVCAVDAPSGPLRSAALCCSPPATRPPSETPSTKRAWLTSPGSTPRQLWAHWVPSSGIP